MGIEQRIDPFELPDELQSWQVITMGERNTPGMLWRRNAASMILLFRQGSHWRVLDHDGPMLAVLDDMDNGWKEPSWGMIPWEDAPEGLSVWEGDVSWGTQNRGLYDEADDPELVGEFRQLTEEEWEAFDAQEDTVWDWRLRAVEYAVWRNYPVHLYSKGLGGHGILSAKGAVCGELDGPAAKWPEDQRHTQNRELVTCPRCIARLGDRSATADMDSTRVEGGPR